MWVTEAQQSPVKRFELRFWPQQNQEETKENSQTEKAFGGGGGRGNLASSRPEGFKPKEQVPKWRKPNRADPHRTQ